MRLATGYILMLLLFFPGVARAQDSKQVESIIERDEKRIEGLRDRIKRQEYVVVDITDREKSIFDGLMLIQKVIDIKNGEAFNLKEKKEQIDSKVAKLEESISTLRGKMTA